MPHAGLERLNLNSNDFPNQLLPEGFGGKGLRPLYPGGMYSHGQFLHPAAEAIPTLSYTGYGGSQAARPRGSRLQAMFANPQGYPPPEVGGTDCNFPPGVGGGGHGQWARRFGHAH